MARTSSGSSTTHSRESSRPGSRQIGQSGWADLIADGDERAGQRSRFRVGRAQEVEGQALCGLWTDPRQASEGLDQAGDGLDDG